MAQSKTKLLTTELKGLNDSTKKLQDQLKRLNKGTKEYIKTEDKLLKVSKERLEIEKQLRKTSGFISENNKKAAATKKAANKEIERSNKLQEKQNTLLKKGTGGFGARIATLGKYLVATKLIQLATQALNFIFVDSAKQAIAFEKDLANLGAVAGVSGEELDKLGQNALKVASTTKFTALEIVQLQTELSKLGFTAEEVISSTADIADVAAALGSGLGETAAAVGKTINQFGLLIEEAGYVGDVLVSSINNSALSFESFGTAIQYIGPLANQLGLDLEQTAAAMGVLADNGFKASRIGTGLRGILTELGKTSADAEHALKKLATENVNLSQAVELVGKRNAAQLITILDNVEALDTSSDKFYEQGRAAQAAAQQMDTFDGQMKILNSAVKEAQINFGDWVTESNLLVTTLGLVSEKAQATVLGLQALRDIELGDLNADIEGILSGDITAQEAAIATIAKQSGKTIEEVTANYERNLEVSGALYNDYAGKAVDYLFNSNKEGNAVLGLIGNYEKLAAAKLEQFEIDKGRSEIQSVYEDEIDALVEARSKGKIVNSEANKLYEELGQAIEINNKRLKNGADLTEGERIRIKAKVSELKKEQKQVLNLIATTEELAKIEKDKFKVDLERIKIMRRDELEELKIQMEAERLLVNTEEERRDFELKFAKERSDINEKYAGELQDIADKMKFAANIEQVEKVIDTWSRLGDISEEAIKQFGDALNGLGDQTEDYIKEQDKLFKAGEIGLDERNTRIKDYVKEQKDSLKLFLADLVKTGELTEEAATNLGQALDNVGDGDTDKFAAKGGIWARILGVDPEDFAADNQAAADALFGKAFRKSAEELLKESLDQIGGVYDEFQQTKADNLKAELDAELDAIKNRYEVEEEILKSSLDNQLITESQFRVKQEELRRAQIAEENSVNRKLFENQQAQDRQNAVVDGAAQVAELLAREISSKGFPAGLISGAAGAGIITAATGARVVAINQRKFFPKKFEDGGMVSGPSHAEGGIPFTVQGQGGYEMEGGEYIINKRSAQMHKDLLDRINNSGRTSAIVGTQKFAQGGQVVGAAADESVTQLKNIAMGISEVAKNTGKPVRAFVTKKDLTTDSRERTIRDRNDRV